MLYNHLTEILLKEETSLEISIKLLKMKLIYYKKNGLKLYVN